MRPASFEEKAARVSDIGVKAAIYGRLFFTALLVMATFASALAYGWGGVLAVQHALDVGTVVALVSYLTRLYAPLLGLSNVQVSVMTALVSFERVFEVLDLPPMIREKPDAIAIPPGPASIAFDHVSFRYPAAAEVSLASLESIAVPDKRPQKTVLQRHQFSALSQASSSRWSGPPARAKPPSPILCRASTTCRAAPFASTASMCATPPSTHSASGSAS